MYRIGVDVGGTNIAVGIVDDSYNIVAKKNVKTSEASEPAEMIDAIAEAVNGLMTLQGLSSADVEAIS